VATDSDILNAALQHMDSLATSLPIAWPGVNFTPPQSGMWFEVRHFPNESENLGLEDSASNLFIGFLQVAVFTRTGSGIVKLTEEAEKIQAHFAKGTEFGPVRVRKRPHQSPPVPSDEAIFIPVTISYRGID